MTNLGIAKIFYLMSEYLEMDGKEPFRPRAYSRAARILEAMTEDVTDIYQKGGLTALQHIPAIGKGLALRIEEYIKTKKIAEFDKLRQKCPVDLENLTAVEGIGPKMIKVLYERLKVKSLQDLEKAARAGKIKNLPRFGEKVQYNILRSIEFLKRGQGRYLLGLILPTVYEIEVYLRRLPEVKKVAVAGSVRRRLASIGDIDILTTTSEPKRVIKAFVNFPRAVKVWGQGATKASIRLRDGFDVDLRVVKPDCFGAALQYFTGSKDHNIALRGIVKDKGLKLNEYGLWRIQAKTEVKLASRTEKAVYQCLDLPYIEPEIRENTGEIEAGQQNQLPKLIGYTDVLGDLQMHTAWSDGAVSIKEMAKAARKIGRKYIAITDHTGDLKVANGLDRQRLLNQMSQIDKVNQRISGIRVLKSAEVNIRKDGSLDMSDELLAKLDLVVAAIHSNLKMSKREMTGRLLRAIKHPLVNIIAHPTGRILQAREGYQLDFEQILAAAKQYNTILEINAYFDRLDLSDKNIRRAVDTGVKLSIGTDSHHPSQLWMIELGISQARRGWAEKDDVVNTKPVGAMLKLLKK